MKQAAMTSGGQDRQRWLVALLLLGCGATFYGLLNRLEMLMPPSAIPAVLCLPSCQPQPPLHPPLAERESLLKGTQPLATLLNETSSEEISILIEKSRYRLTVFHNLEPVKSYAVVFGSSPVEDKRSEGDMRTPEGIFYIRDRYPHPDWSKFIWLNYPTPQSWRKHLAAKFSGEIRPLATVGSAIGIHGVPESADGLIDQKNNWTWGCISLKNSDVDEIYDVVGAGTAIEIVP